MSKITKKYWGWADNRQDINIMKHELESKGITNLRLEYKYGPPEVYTLYTILNENTEIDNNTLLLQSIRNYIYNYCCLHR